MRDAESEQHWDFHTVFLFPDYLSPTLSNKFVFSLTHFSVSTFFTSFCHYYSPSMN